MLSIFVLALSMLGFASFSVEGKMPTTFNGLQSCQQHCYRDCVHELALEQSIMQLSTDLDQLRNSVEYEKEANSRRKNPTKFRPISLELENVSSMKSLSLGAREAMLANEVAKSKHELSEYIQWREAPITSLGWDCHENCRYECMHMDNSDRVNRGLDVVKYNGKWPFIRVLGTQEFFSSLFSLANAVPHFIFFFKWRREAPANHFMTPIMLSYAVSAVHTWWWSTAFHARDNWFTHNMDYFFATFTIMFMVFLTFVRVFSLKHRLAWMGLALPFISYFIYHVYYMLYVDWDYDYNMNLAISLGVALCGTWIVYGLCVIKQKPYAWKVVTMATIIAIFAGFEVFDFPPIMGLLDAHAIWHGATPYAAWLFWEYLLEDAQKEQYRMIGATKNE